MQLLEFINMYFNGNRSEFGRSLDKPVTRDRVNYWLAKKYTIEWDEDGKIWLKSPMRILFNSMSDSPRRPLIKE